mmetsp:Transcript_3924/g.8965  ORF Transcript_3924/g.8965 Transcript_3924/m.8965 type:complete len:86 (-) Transcript_3924:1299-1556(-)
MSHSTLFAFSINCPHLQPSDWRASVDTPQTANAAYTYVCIHVSLCAFVAYACGKHSRQTGTDRQIENRATQIYKYSAPAITDGRH